MKQLASLTENQSCRFLIPSNFINYNGRLLNDFEIDQFIHKNQLIVRDEAKTEVQPIVENKTEILEISEKSE